MTVQTTEPSDAALVAGSLAGNREAFGRIVARYQTLVCSLAYSSTGSLSQSEDLAQETFVAAWKQMASLREPHKLRSWLCGIARNRICDALKQQGREPSHAAEPLDTLHETPASEPPPHDLAISREEEAILWRSLERIPETYREPLVLFYREHQSIENVAAALDLTEDAVKQRLSRGRKLLHEQVLAFVEGALERTNPGKAFTLGVVAALPVFATTASAATVGTAAIKGTSAAKSAGILGAIGFGAALGLVAVFGSIFTIRGRIQNARSVRERQFLARASWGILVWKILFLAVLLTVFSFTGGMIINNVRGATAWSLVWLVLFGVWVAYSIWVSRRQKQIQMEEGVYAEVAACPSGNMDPARKGFRPVVFGGLAALIFGPGGLLLVVTAMVGDRLAVAALSMLAVMAWLLCARGILRRPERLKTVFRAVWGGLSLATLATFNLRFHVWVKDPRQIWPDDPTGFHFPPLWLNVPLLAFFGSIGLAWWLEHRLATTRDFKRDAAMAGSAFVVLLLLGTLYCLAG